MLMVEWDDGRSCRAKHSLFLRFFLYVAKKKIVPRQLVYSRNWHGL